MPKAMPKVEGARVRVVPIAKTGISIPSTRAPLPKAENSVRWGRGGGGIRNSRHSSARALLAFVPKARKRAGGPTWMDVFYLADTLMGLSQ